MVSVAWAGHVLVRWPAGLAKPSSKRAVAVPPSLPGSHVSSTDLTWLDHGVSTAVSVFSTTAVFGLASPVDWIICVEPASSEATAADPPQAQSANTTAFD